ncbi:MAG: glycosyltransferase [bacterium]
MRIGIDLHNLSTRADASVRTGIQQVVAHILLAQSRLRGEVLGHGIQLVPLPMLPLAFKIPSPSHVNNSAVVLRNFADETNSSIAELWDNSVGSSSANWSDQEFYERCADLDWLVITGLCDFDHVVRRLRASLPKLKVAVLVYDLGPVRRPELVALGMGEWFESRYLRSIRAHADLVFTISRHTGLDCAEYFKQWPEFSGDLYSTPLPSEVPALQSVSEGQVDMLLQRLGVKRGRFFVAIGTIEPRKNLGAAILGFRRFCEIEPNVTEDMRFLLVGKRGWNNEDARLLELLGDRTHQVIFPGYLSREDVEMTMLSSAGLLMPSRLEGFGLPLALADRLGVPTVTCNNSSLPETTSQSSIFVPTDGADQMALALWRLAARPVRALPSQETLNHLRETLTNSWDQLLRDWLDCMRGKHGLAA